VSRLYPGAARSLVEQAMKAGWTGTFGPYLEQPVYTITLNPPRPNLHLSYTAKWRLKDGRWQVWYAECRHSTKSTTDQVRLDEIAKLIKASAGAS
jgi:hypothetical protein